MAVDISVTHGSFGMDEIARMTRRELEAAKVVLGLSITEIQTALAEREHEPLTRETDDAPEWVAYRRWRRRANAALRYRRREIAAVKLRLQREIRVVSDEHAARATALRAELDGRPVDALLLDAYRLIRRAFAASRDGEPGDLPDWLDERDRHTVALVGRYLRDRMGKSEIAAALR